MSVEVMRNELNPCGAPDFKAVATQSVGTMEILQAMAKLVLKGSHPEVVMHILPDSPCDSPSRHQ